MKNIVLIGFMGSGKSTIGRRLAQRLGWDFVDTDRLVETRENMSVAEIFRAKGEAAFRAMESEAVEECLGTPHCVVSTGGGAILSQSNLRAILDHSHAICLWISPEEAYERTRHHSHRPLLQEPDPLARIRELLAQREPIYRQAHFIIDTTGRPVPEIVDTILRYLHSREPGIRNAD
ncbi:shikimate kinase [Kamptonema cortianum]|nr:shikimate kinase [Kamptonema cortianum]MDL5046075.1 shikimate kinase [Oscillatoria amoena NRMC-F 0135]MDL5052781.1 shikimate kinase [Oscillatoria laete-virens NRMC-F 0139]